MAEKTLTAALALIKVVGYDNNNYVIGKMRNLRVTENFRRGRIVGIGEITPSELPVLEWTGNSNAGQYAIKLNTGIMYAISRAYNTVADFVQNLLFNEGVDIAILQKIKLEDGTFDQETFCKIPKAHLTSEGLDISEGQIGGRDASFEYLNPIVYS